ncbi:MAG: AsmA family protein [Proteobacteria bacterium]|nr:AsmA family protein [Pseudomonadota bacterium]
MNDTAAGKNRYRTVRKLLIRSFLVVVCLCTLGVISLKIYLGTPHASSLLSRTLTSYLHQSVRVTSLHTAGGSLYLTGVSLGNPPDLPPGNLAEADSIIIAPNWGALLTGRRSVRLIAFEGLRLNLQKNSAGIWNFSKLQHLFTDKKTAGTELFVGQLVVNNGAIQINGRGAKGISLQLLNLATKGSNNARIKLSFEDAARNNYTVTGTTRPGPRPAFDLTLAAPSLSLDSLAGLLKQKNTPLSGESNGSLQVTAVLQDGLLRAGGSLDFSRLLVPFRKRALPVTGSVTFAAVYTINTDEARLESLSVTAANLMKGHASGTITRVSSERRFAGDIGIDELNLAALTLLLPEAERAKTVLGGTLRSTELRVSGSGSQGLTSARGAVMLKNCSLEREGQLLFTALAGTANFSRVPDGFLVKGKLFQSETRSAALLETLQAPFEITLSRRLKLLKGEIPSLTANVMGLAVDGRLGYSAAVPAPFSAALRISAARFSSLHHLPEKLHLQLASGSGSLDLEAAGRGIRDFTAAATARVSAVQGTRSGTRFGIKTGVVDSRIIRNNGQVGATGNARFTGLSLDGREGDAQFSYRIADRTAVLDNAAFSFAGVSGAVARLTAVIPVKEATAGTVRYPLSLDVAGGELRRGQADLHGFSGTMRGSYRSDPRGRWLEGMADGSSARVVWQGSAVASPAVHVTFSRTGGVGTVSGTVLEGALSGKITFNPFALREGGGFELGIRGARLSNLGKILSRRGAATLSNGMLAAAASGSYSAAAGLVCRFEASGGDIALTGSGGKALFGGGGIKLSGGVSGSRLVVSNALFTAGKGVVLQVKGEVNNPLTPQRAGTLTFSLPRTPLTSVIDPFVNILPRVIQEATVDGSMASEGTIILRDGRQLLDGALLLKGVLFEVPSQQLRAADINGRIPFSLDLSGNTPVKIKETSRFSRENYPLLLKQLRAAPVSGQPFTIGSVDFGSVKLGEVLLQISAGNGVTKIDSLRSSLYEGVLLGTGFVAVKKGISYRADLLINGLSLKRFCATIPKIKDYISGRLDGVISLNGEGATMAGVTGFTDLWVREGSGEKMLVSKEFLQKLSGKKLSGFFFSSDRPFDSAEIAAILEGGNLTFNRLDIMHTNFFGVRDLSVSIAPTQNRIALDHLFTAIKQAATRGKATTGETPSPAPAGQEFKWQE